MSQPMVQQGHLCGPPVFEGCNKAVIIEAGGATFKAALHSFKPNHVAVLQEDREIIAVTVEAGRSPAPAE